MQAEWTDRMARVTLIVALFSLAVLSFYGAAAPLKSDDVWSVRVTRLPFPKMLAELKDDVHPPLYYVILHVWRRWFGEGEVALRSLSAVFYILATWAIFGVARRFYGRNAALFAATVFLLSPLAILSAQLVRMYSLALLLAALSADLFFTLLLDDEVSWGSWAAYIAVTALGTFTHIWFFFLLFAEVCGFLVFRGRAAVAPLAAAALSLVPFAVLWLPAFLRQLAKSAEAGAWLQPPTFQELLMTLLLQGGAFWLLAPALVYFLWRKAPPAASARPAGVALFLFIVTTGVPFFVSYAKPVFYSRFTVVALPFFALAVTGLFAHRLNHQAPLLLAALTLPVMVYLASRGHPCGNLAAAEIIARQARAGDVVVYSSLSRQPVSHYLERLRVAEGVLQTTFPKEIDIHPGYEGKIWDPARRPRLEQEAGELVAEIERRGRERPGTRVLFLHGFRPEVDAVLKSRLDLSLKPLPAAGIACGAMESYFDRITVYEGLKEPPSIQPPPSTRSPE